MRVGVGRNLLGRGKKELSGMIKMFSVLLWVGGTQVYTTVKTH